MARLTKYEKETIILFNEGEDKASMALRTLSPVWQSALICLRLRSSLA